MARSLHDAADTRIVPTGVSMLLYGKSGDWKTALACQFPRPVVFRGPAELGTDHLKEQGIIAKDIPVAAAESFEELQDWVYDAGRGDDYDTLIFDTFYDLQVLLYNHVGEKHFKGVMGEGFDAMDKRGFRAFGKGESITNEQYLIPFLKMLVADILPMPKNVIAIAHAEVKPVSNPGGDDYEQFRPMIDKKFATKTISEFQQVGFIGRDIILKEKKGTKTKAESYGDLMLNFDQTDTHFEAKNRYGLPPFIAMGDSAKEGFTNLAKAFAEANHPIAGLDRKPATPKPAAPARPAARPSRPKR